MQFKTQLQAKKFFIDKIILQAQKQGIALSEAEKYMLGWTETEGGFELNQQLIDKYHEQTTDDKYEKKVSSLIKSSFESDILTDPSMKITYHAAYQLLNQGDHYLLVMIKQAFQGLRAEGNLVLWLKKRLLLILTGLGMTLVPMFIITYFDLRNYWLLFMWACIFSYLLPFGIYSHTVYKSTQKERPSLSKAKIHLFQIGIALVTISIYVYLIVQFNLINLAAYQHGRDNFILINIIIGVPLLIISISLLDFTLQQGILYDGIAVYLDKLKKKT